MDTKDKILTSLIILWCVAIILLLFLIITSACKWAILAFAVVIYTPILLAYLFD